MSAKCELKTLQVDFLAEVYPTYAENQRSLFRRKMRWVAQAPDEKSQSADAEEIRRMIGMYERVERWLFAKYRRRAERDGLMDRNGRIAGETFGVKIQFPKIRNYERRAA